MISTGSYANKDADQVREALREKFNEVYGIDLGLLQNEQHIFSDLHADEPDPVFALEWIWKTQKILNKKPEQPKTKAGKREVTIGVLVDFITGLPQND